MATRWPAPAASIGGRYGAEIGWQIMLQVTPVSCFVEREKVYPQPGGYYGGCVTRAIVGPFKGGPGTEAW
jgi:hypothetical protein